MKLRKSPVLLLLLILWLLIASSGPAASGHLATADFSALPSIEEVLNNYITAAGGKKTLAQIFSLKFQGQIIYEYPDRKPVRSSAQVEIYSESPDKWRFILHTSQGRQQMGFDGRDGSGFKTRTESCAILARSAQKWPLYSMHRLLCACWIIILN